ncbi:MAG: 50S ribosomal protein L35 [Candidatus Nealsonbacteria bacterium]
MKTRKSIKKRFKFTKTGKVLRRAIGQDHHRMKKSGNTKRKLRKLVKLGKVESKMIKRLLHN